MADSNGITQSPFSEAACPTPSATSGDQGTGGGFTADAGPNGITNSPFDKAIVPTPTQMVESGPFGNPSRYSTVDGSTHQGESLMTDVTSLKRTVDKR